MERKWIQTEDFFIGNFGDPEATDEILSILPSELNYKEGTVGTEELPDHESRKCLVSWMDVKKSNFIELGLKKIIINVNDIIWKLNIKGEWDGSLQFTKYSGKGDHYGWHVDNYLEGGSDRILSIVYCLSKASDYKGAELDIEKSDQSIYTTVLDYGDFVVFPSTTPHRVRPLIDGVRTTMVGWMI